MTTVMLRRWADDDRDLLVRGNAADMTEHLGGPESDEEVRVRHENYLRFWREGTARMYAIVVDGESVGAIGWWTTRWREEDVHETGWFVLPHAQGRGVARAAVNLIIDDAREHGDRRLLTAYPSVDNTASNALCAGCGFERIGQETFPFRGRVLDVNVWVLRL
ncbi:MAG: GNAT family N-acetyltransferase [Actinomycetota bacterium]